MKKILQKPQAQLQKILQKAEEIAALDTCLSEFLEPELAKHCAVANLRENCLIIVCDSATWATHLRYATPDLLQQLRRKKQFYQLRSIEHYVRGRM